MKAAGQRENACPRQHVHVTQVHKSRREERHCRRTERPYTLDLTEAWKMWDTIDRLQRKVVRAQPARACTECREWPGASRVISVRTTHVVSRWAQLGEGSRGRSGAGYTQQQVVHISILCNFWPTIAIYIYILAGSELKPNRPSGHGKEKKNWLLTSF